MVASSGGSTVGAISKCYLVSRHDCLSVCCTFIYSRLNDIFSTAVAGPLSESSKHTRRTDIRQMEDRQVSRYRLTRFKDA